MKITLKHKLVYNLSPQEYREYSRCNMNWRGAMQSSIMGARRRRNTAYAILAYHDASKKLIAAGLVDREHIQIYVRQSFRRKRIGTRILRRALYISKVKKWDPSVLPWDDKSQEFYGTQYDTKAARVALKPGRKKQATKA